MKKFTMQKTTTNSFKIFIPSPQAQQLQLSIITANELVTTRIQSTIKQMKKRTHYFIL